jgi:hypothetical protein
LSVYLERIFTHFIRLSISAKEFLSGREKLIFEQKMLSGLRKGNSFQFSNNASNFSQFHIEISLIFAAFIQESDVTLSGAACAMLLEFIRGK